MLKKQKTADAKVQNRQSRKKTANAKTQKARKKIKDQEIKKPRKKTANAKTQKGAKIQKKKEEKKKEQHYYEAVGRRKTATARIRLYTKGKKDFVVNGKPYNEYFSIPELQKIATSSLKKMNSLDRFGVSVLVRGGGLHAQAEATRHGTARALVSFNPDFKKRLKSSGYLTRDPRMRERKKFGLKRARRAPQWRKR